ncbi:autotransporter outer membrane beta-barrel domain-containing protein [Pseudomonas weihenstephanensis]|nr:autotransporter outer membrane beta-barrel domain-containing protein [Pseudomonas weihenstephanensis]
MRVIRMSRWFSSESMPHALLLGAFVVASPSAGAVLIENGTTITINAGHPKTDYTLRTGATLNIDGGTADQVSSNASNLNINKGDTAEIVGLNGSVLTLSGATVTGTVGSGLGIELHESEATISAGSTVISDGIGLNAMQNLGAFTGSTFNVSDSTIIGTTAGAQASGHSALNFTNSHVEATGEGSAGLILFSADVTAKNSKIIGEANGIRVFRNGSTNPKEGNIVLDGTSVQGVTGSAILVDGAGRKIPDVNLDIINGSTLLAGNNLLLDVTGGATANVNVLDSHLEGNIKMSGDSTGNLDFTHGFLTGDVIAEAGSTARITLDKASVFTGNVDNIERVVISNASRWNMKGDNSVGTLDLHDGTVDFGSSTPGTFYQLNAEHLSGQGTFVMDVDMARSMGDKLNVTGEATGSHSLLVTATGADPVSNPADLTLVHIASGDATFGLANAAPRVDQGTYSYALESKSDGAGGTEWFLGANKHISPSASSVLALFNTAPTVWYGELSSLRSRMGELRFDGGQSGVWMRSYGNKFNVSESTGLAYKQTQHGFSLGADAPLPIGDGQWLVGVLGGTSKSDLDLSRGTSGTVKSYYVGAYTTWLDQSSGYYVDAVLKYNRFSNQAKVSMSDGARAKGDYDNAGLGASAEFGRHIKLDDGYFIEPFAQVAGVVIQAKDYGLNNGMEAEGDRTRSLLAKAGMTAGRNVALKNGAIVQPYIRAAMVHEFAKNNEVQVNNNVFNNDLSGSRAEFGAGLAVSVTSNLQVHADFDYGNGKNIEQPWGANVGLRYSW